MNTLALFDIDGTLIKAGLTQHHDSYALVWRAVYQIDKLNFNWRDRVAWLRHEGKTDSKIILEVAKEHGVRQPRARLQAALDVMAEYYDRNAKKDRLECLPGVRKLLCSLQKKGVSLGSVTGNLEPVARKKLKLVRKNHFFPVGGFGNEALYRSQLIMMAISRAREFYSKNFGKGRIFFFGDTVRDVRAAHKNHVKSVAVATGHFTVEQLKEQSPFALFRDLSNTSVVLAAMGL